MKSEMQKLRFYLVGQTKQSANTLYLIKLNLLRYKASFVMWKGSQGIGNNYISKFYSVLL